MTKHSIGPDAVAGVQRRSLADALFKAIIKCRFQRVKFLLDNGVSPLVVNDGHQNILIAALYIPDDEKRDTMFRYLVKRKADCCYMDKTTGRDVTAWAAYLGRWKQVECIFESVVGEVDLHAKDNEGMTPLHSSVIAGHLETVKVLINYLKKYDLSLDIADSQGLSPFIYARRLGYNEIAEELMNAGCSTGIFDTITYRTADQWAEIGRKERKQQKLREKEMEKTGLIHRPKKAVVGMKLPSLKITTSDDVENDIIINFTRTSPVESVVEEKFSRPVSPITIVGMPKNTVIKSILKPYTAVESKPVRHTPRRTTFSAESRLSSIDYRLREDTKLLLSMQHMSSSNNNLNKSSFDNLCTIMDIVAQQCTHTYRPSIIPQKPKKPNGKGKFSSLAFVLRTGKKGKTQQSNSRSVSPVVSEKKAVPNMASFMGAISASKNLATDDKKKKKIFPTLSAITS